MKSLFQPVLRRGQFLVGRGPAEQRQPALAIADGGEKADALAAQVGPVNHNGRLALEAGQLADGGHQGALSLDGVKAGVGEEAEVALAYSFCQAWWWLWGSPGIQGRASSDRERARRLRMAAVSRARLVRLVARI